MSVDICMLSLCMSRKGGGHVYLCVELTVFFSESTSFV